MKAIFWVFVVGLMTVTLAVTAPGQEIRLDNVGSSTGDLIDGTGTGDLPQFLSVAEIVGLGMTVTAITSDAAGAIDLNVTSTALGVDAIGSTEGGTDLSDQFDAVLNESTTWQFDQAVIITGLDLVQFDTGESFEFGGQAIGFGDLTSTTTDTYSFAGGLHLAANTAFTIRATAGSIGIEGVTLNVVPEPAASVLLGLSTLALVSRRPPRK